MSRTIPMVEARSKLTSLPEQFAENPDVDAVVVTRRGQPVLAILPWELYDSLMDTMQILADPQLMSDLKQSIKEIQDGKTEDWEAVKAELGL